MAVLTHIFECILGVLFMFGAFFATGMGGPFSRGPYHPISRTGRFIIFLAGAVVFVDGFYSLLGFARLKAGWRTALPLAVVALLALFPSTKLVRAYVGRRVTSRPEVIIKFSGGLPRAMLGARVAFFVIAAILLILGIAPVADSIARRGIIACVLALFVLAFSYDWLESRYINDNRATEVKLPADPGSSKQN